MYFFEATAFSEQLLFQKRCFLRAGISWKQSFFLIVLRNQFHSIYTWTGFPLTNICSFKYTMVWSDFEIPRFFIIKNSKKRINFNAGYVTNVTFWKLVVILIDSKKLQKIILTNSVALLVQKMMQWEFVKMVKN